MTIHVPGTESFPRPLPGPPPFSRLPYEPDDDASDDVVELDAECDFCGRAVRRETASERVHGTDDGDEIIFLCHDCEFGAD